MPGANHGQLQYEEIAGRQMANVDDRRGCGIIFQRRQPTSFLPVAQCHATFGRVRPPCRVRSEWYGTSDTLSESGPDRYHFNHR